MHYCTQHALTLTVNDPNFKNPPLSAFGKIVWDEVHDFRGTECMKVEGPVYREIDWIIIIV